MNTPTISSPEAIPFALDLLKKTDDKASLLRLVSEVYELGRKRNIHLPAWVGEYLEEAIREARHNPAVDPVDFIQALLTLNLSHPSPTLEAEATHLINRAYRNLKAKTSSPKPKSIRPKNLLTSLYISSTYCDYVDGFDITRIIDSYNTLTSQLTQTIPTLSNLDRARLHTIHTDNAPYLP